MGRALANAAAGSSVGDLGCRKPQPCLAGGAGTEHREGEWGDGLWGPHAAEKVGCVSH